MKIEDCVSFEVAELLKDKGYNEYCRFFIYKEGATEDCNSSLIRFPAVKYENLEEGDILRPFLYDVQKWLIDKHKIYVSAHVFPIPRPLTFSWCAELQSLESFDDWGKKYREFNWKYISFDTPQEALDFGIKEALKYI